MLEILVGKTIKSVESKEVDPYDSEGENVQTAFKIETTDGKIFEFITDSGDVSRAYGALESLITGEYDKYPEFK